MQNNKTNMTSSSIPTQSPPSAFQTFRRCKKRKDQDGNVSPSSSSGHIKKKDVSQLLFSPLVMKPKAPLASSNTKKNKRRKKTATIVDQNQHGNTLESTDVMLPAKPAPVIRGAASRHLQNVLQVAKARFLSHESSSTKHLEFQDHDDLGITHVGIAETRGTRAYMEDRYQIVAKFLPSASKSYYCGIFDGHNGSLASEYAATRFHDIFMRVSGPDLDLEAQILQACAELEDEIMKVTYEQGHNDGTTALMTFVVEDQLYIANLGDCRAVLSRKNSPSVVRLSEDHKPNLESERVRVESLGGKVMFSGCWRVAHDELPIRLAISRSFGDHQLKFNLPESCTGPLVSAVPEITRFNLTPEDEFIILATDGLWDRVQDEEAVAIVRKHFEANEDGEGNYERAIKSAANELIELALNRRSFDNITVLIMTLN